MRNKLLSHWCTFAAFSTHLQSVLPVSLLPKNSVFLIHGLYPHLVFLPKTKKNTKKPAVANPGHRRSPTTRCLYAGIFNLRFSSTFPPPYSASLPRDFFFFFRSKRPYRLVTFFKKIFNLKTKNTHLRFCPGLARPLYSAQRPVGSLLKWPSPAQPRFAGHGRQVS